MKARENPFRVERVHDLPFRFENSSFDEFYQRLEQTRYRGAIIGPHGTGKTTLLNEIQSRFRLVGIPYHTVRLIDDGRSLNQERIRDWLASSSEEMVLILDSAGLLSYWDWARIKRRAKNFAGLLITAHKPGRLPTLIELRPTSQTLIDLINELDCQLNLPDELVENLFREHKGNIRDCLRALYDDFARSSLKQ